MPPVYTTATVNGRQTLVVNAIDGAGAGANMRLLDGNGAVLSSLPLAFPSGVVSGGVLTFSGLPLLDPAAAGTGFATAARIDDAVGTTQVAGLTVGLGSTSDVILSPTTQIVAGKTVAVQQATITGH